MERFLPARSLLLQAPVAEWPETMTNWDLLQLAKGWRGQLVSCNADKAAIEAEAYGNAPAAAEGGTPAPAAKKPWWRFW